MLTSTEVLKTWSLTASGSQIFKFLMSESSPVSPLTPQKVSPLACLALRAVNNRMIFAPQFCAKVRGMTCGKI